MADSPELRNALVSLSQLRNRKGEKKKPGNGEPTGWLKNIDSGELAGLLIATSLPDLGIDNDIREKITALRSWVDAT